MSIAKVTYHSRGPSAVPRYPDGELVGVLPDQVGNREHVTFTAAPGHGALQTKQVIAVILADADCGIGVTDGATPVTLAKTRPIKAGVEQSIRIREGQRLGVIADANAV
jgi:hypothetical protein